MAQHTNNANASETVGCYLFHVCAPDLEPFGGRSKDSKPLRLERVFIGHAGRTSVWSG